MRDLRNEIFGAETKPITVSVRITERDMRDLQILRKVRAGEIKKHVEHDYVIINGDHYRKHGCYPWKNKEE